MIVPDSTFFRRYAKIEAAQLIIRSELDAIDPVTEGNHRPLLVIAAKALSAPQRDRRGIHQIRFKNDLPDLFISGRGNEFRDRSYEFVDSAHNHLSRQCLVSRHLEFD